jgi:hypothetical protein
VSKIARSDHRVEKVVNNAPGIGRWKRRPNAQLGSRQVEPLARTRDS